MTLSAEPPDFALEWCRRLGANPDSLESLQGGINNQVFLCKVGQQPFVLKGYREVLESGHDQFRAEVEFLNYAQLVAPEFVPQLVNSDTTSRSVVLEYIEGERFKEGTTPSQEDINQAVTFMRLLNRDLKTGKDLVTGRAAEGFLRITEHLNNVDQRLGRMSIDHLPANVACEAQWFIGVARERLNTLQERTEQLLSQGHCPDAVDPKAQSLSPSDFGFHNAIRQPTGVRFFDFEFAGWDDSVKAVADFDLQPKVPINPRMQAQAKAMPAWTETLKARYELLFPILQLKWACIIMKVLDPLRWTQMTRIELTQTPQQSFQSKVRLARAYLLGD